MLMERRTSPLASGNVLPSSLVISAAMESKRRSSSSAALNRILPRAGPPMVDHGGAAGGAGIRAFRDVLRRAFREKSDEIFGVCRIALLEGLGAFGPFSVDIV